MVSKLRYNTGYPLLAVAGGVLMVSYAALFIRLTGAPPLVVAFYRMGLAFLFQAPFVLPTAHREIGPGSHREAGLAVLAGLALAAHFAAWVTSLRLTTVANSTLLVATQPIWVALVSYLVFGEKLPWGKTGALALALTGAVVIGFGDMVPAAADQQATSLVGDLLAVLGAVFMAAYLMLGREAQKRLSAGIYTLIAYGVSAAALLVMAVAHGDRLYPYPPAEWLAFVGLAVVCTLGGHSLLNWSLRTLPATTVSSANLAEPVAASLWALLFLGEAPGIRQVGGGALVLAGLVWFTHSAREKTPEGKARLRGWAGTGGKKN